MMMTIVPLFVNTNIHFGTTITLVLTAQLCLYTLFQSSLVGIPKTAYLKDIDLWNMGILFVSLTNFFTLFLWEILPQSQIKSRIKNVMKITIPIITLIGVTSYWIMTGLRYFG